MIAKLEGSRLILNAENEEENNFLYHAWVDGIKNAEFDTHGLGELVIKIQESE